MLGFAMHLVGVEVQQLGPGFANYVLSGLGAAATVHSNTKVDAQIIQRICTFRNFGADLAIGNGSTYTDIHRRRKRKLNENHYHSIYRIKQGRYNTPAHRQTGRRATLLRELLLLFNGLHRPSGMDEVLLPTREGRQQLSKWRQATRRRPSPSRCLSSRRCEAPPCRKRSRCRRYRERLRPQPWRACVQPTE